MPVVCCIVIALGVSLVPIFSLVALLFFKGEHDQEEDDPFVIPCLWLTIRNLKHCFYTGHGMEDPTCARDWFCNNKIVLSWFFGILLAILLFPLLLVVEELIVIFVPLFGLIYY